MLNNPRLYRVIMDLSLVSKKLLSSFNLDLHILIVSIHSGISSPKGIHQIHSFPSLICSVFLVPLVFFITLTQVYIGLSYGPSLVHWPTLLHKGKATSWGRVYCSYGLIHILVRFGVFGIWHRRFLNGRIPFGSNFSETY